MLNLLSVGAAYGVLVAVFQYGWGENLLNFQSNGGIAHWLPIFMFVILFGLSMDYHVFILSRVREAFDRGMKTEDAVAHGIKTTAGVVSSAALVMVGVFSIFATLPIIDMKEMGIGLAAAVLIDATIVRGVLLPATMKLLGDWNWYLPNWLELAAEARARAAARRLLRDRARPRHVARSKEAGVRTSAPPAFGPEATVGPVILRSALAAAALLAAASPAQSLAAVPAIRVVASGLDNPRGVAVTAGGVVYVAEAGRAGKCRPNVGCFGFTSAVTEIRNASRSGSRRDLLDRRQGRKRRDRRRRHCDRPRRQAVRDRHRLNEDDPAKLVERVARRRSARCSRSRPGRSRRHRLGRTDEQPGRRPGRRGSLWTNLRRQHDRRRRRRRKRHPHRRQR